MDAQPTDFAIAPARPAAAAASQFVTFSAGENVYGIDIMSVREIRSWSPTTPLPGRPFGAMGVLDIRGSVVEVYDLSAILGGPGIEARTGHVVLVVALGLTNVGIVVDTVSDIIFAKADDFREPPSAGGGAKVSNLVQQGELLVAILDLGALFADAGIAGVDAPVRAN